jgi:hypothetical protein
MVFMGAINNPQMSLTASICRAAGLFLASPGEIPDGWRIDSESRVF